MEITGTPTVGVIGTTIIVVLMIIVRRKEEELTGPASETGAGIRGAAGVMTGIVTDFKWAEVCGRLGLPLFYRIGKFALYDKNPPGDAHSAPRKYGC